MSDLALKATTVQVSNGDLQISAYLAQPEAAGSFPAVIVFQEIFGVNEHIRDVTERIAKEGYVAIAPAIFQRQAPGLELDYTPADVELGRRYKNQTQASELLSDTQAVIDYLKQLPGVKANAIATIGFCFGGHVAYLIASNPEIKATASFYGAGITTLTLGASAPTLSCTAKITGQLYAFCGEQDASIPPDQVEQIRAELEKYQVPHQIFLYPADHGFFCDRRASYQPEATADAWIKVKQLFQRTL
jgi:carboxymethylenebutenolidase